jgi:hypothetical protein
VACAWASPAPEHQQPKFRQEVCRAEVLREVKVHRVHPGYAPESAEMSMFRRLA